MINQLIQANSADTLNCIISSLELAQLSLDGGGDDLILSKRQAFGFFLANQAIQGALQFEIAKTEKVTDKKPLDLPGLMKQIDGISNAGLKRRLYKEVQAAVLLCGGGHE